MCRPTRIKDNHVTARKRAPLLSYYFLTEVEAEISLPKSQMTLGRGKNQERINLFKEKSGSVSYCLMAKAKWKKTDWKQ